MTVYIPANDHGQIRIFSLSPPMSHGLEEKTPEALKTAFGTTNLNPDFIDVIDTEDLSGLTLMDYLREGYDLHPDATDHAALHDLRGPVVLMMSRATEGADVTLTLADGVRHITTITDPARMTLSDALESESAKGTGPVGRAPPSNAAMSGRVATVALVVLFLIAGLMIWVAA